CRLEAQALESRGANLRRVPSELAFSSLLDEFTDYCAKVVTLIRSALAHQFISRSSWNNWPPKS
ncbi:hypothetical protein TSAR_016087, partial [Trichomalopsis sarcophagae]